jgi:hypothetical protein
LAQRINITVPDELFKRLQAVKDRLNISRVCQEAIMGAVEMQELKMKDIPGIDKLVERLRAEKEEFGEMFRKQGVESGRKDALELDYGTFIAVERMGEHIDRDSLPDWLHEHLDELESDDPSFDRGEYLTGWVEGVTEVWEEVKDQL